MTKPEQTLPSPDWDRIRAFLAVVESGSLTAAANQLATSQPTLSRQLAALESELGTSLFERVGRGLCLTQAGKALLIPAQQMQAAAYVLSLTAAGHNLETSGTVRISASEVTATFVLPAILASLRKDHPEIQVELAVTNRVENLLEREADIAIRHTQPGQGSLIARRLGGFRLGAFAHRNYLRKVGGHIDASQLSRYDWIGLDRSDLLLRGFQQAGFKVGREFFSLRCDDQVTGWHLVAAGMGIGFGTHFVANQFRSIQPVLTTIAIPSMPVWITTHRELRSSVRIRTVFDALANGLLQCVDTQSD